MRMGFLLLCAVAVSLSGCMTPEEHTRIVNADIANREEVAKKQYCADLGTPEGSYNYNDCRFKLDELIATRAKMGIPVNGEWWERQKLHKNDAR